MSKRLQVIVSDEEYEALKEASDEAGQTLSEWIRGALRTVRRQRSTTRTDRKLAAVRAAVRNEFPTGDMEVMLAEIESGYLG
jgi:molybdopterin biosynthesis enzyme MoaB